MKNGKKSDLQISQEAREYAENIVNTVREPLVVLDADLRVVGASRSFYRVFKVDAKATEGQLIYDLGNRQWDIPTLRKLLEEILPKHTQFNDYEVEHDFQSIGKRIMLLNARRIYQEMTNIKLILLAIEDITENRTRHNLQKRIKELNCVYGFSQIIEKPNITIQEILQGLVNIIPPAYQYPEITCAKITFEGKEYKTKNFQDTKWKKVADIIVNDEKKGSLEVCYLKQQPEIDEGSLLKEERSLIAALAQQLGRVIERNKVKINLFQFQKAIDNSTDAIGMASPEGRHYYQNEAFTKLFGLSVKEIDGASGPQSTVYVDEKVGREVFATIMAGGIWDKEVEMYDRDKNVINVSLRAYPIKDSNNKTIALIGIHTDMTKRMKLQQELEKKLHDLEIFYKATTDRELKMMELKKEIVILKERIVEFESKNSS
ncbi:MAG: PAS domain-containing protein [Candidatus Omnitrophica bacterium]|nr:PAS domain-containing protein [Candidatus Omnitrophota bacterium]